MCETEYASFLIRCWSEQETPGKCTGWQGEIEHIQTGHTISLRSLEDLVAVLYEWPARQDNSNDCAAI